MTALLAVHSHNDYSDHNFANAKCGLEIFSILLLFGAEPDFLRLRQWPDLTGRRLSNIEGLLSEVTGEPRMHFNATPLGVSEYR